MRCHIDIETFSCIDLTKVGHYKYADHFTTEILCFAYAIDNEDPEIWVLEDGLLPTIGAKAHVGLKCPDSIRAVMDDPEVELHAFNAGFERVLLNGRFARAVGIPATGRERWHCTKAVVAAAGLPQSLEAAGLAFGNRHQKDKDGKGEMLQISKPKKPSKKDPRGRYRPENYPEKFTRLYSYCLDDVWCERELAQRLPPLSRMERRAYLLDQKINDRGVYVDIPAIRALSRVRDERKSQIREEMKEMTGGIPPGSTERVRQWLRADHRGFHATCIPDMMASTVESRVEALDKTLDKYAAHLKTVEDGGRLAPTRHPAEDRNITIEDVREGVRVLSENKKVLELYSAFQMKAPSKLDAMLRAAGRQSRLRGMFVFHGAATGRYSSRIVQLQNLKRPAKGVNAEEVIDGVVDGSLCLNDMRKAHDMEPLSLISSCVRGMIAPKPGHSLVCMDFGQIEARVLSWLANAPQRLKVFRDGEDIYTHTASAMFGIPVSDIAKDSEERFLGKTGELALGYQGGAGAFVSMAKNFGRSVEEHKADETKWAWREANPEIAGGTGFWAQINEAATRAVKSPGSVFSISEGRIRFRVEDRWLVMRLPSGRRVRYLDPEIQGAGRREAVTYMGIDTYTRQWKRVNTYGGKLTENVVQAISYDLQQRALNVADGEWLPLVLHVHDEMGAEVPVEEAEDALEQMHRIMTDLPKWAEGLPIAAEGFIAQRYRK